MSNVLIHQLPMISLELNRFVAIFQIVFGTFGNVMNILIFSRRSLRSNPCSLYFLASSINNLFFLYVATLTRMLSSGWNIDPSNSNLILCRSRIFLVYTSLCLIQWFVVLASIDRYFSSCHTTHQRRWSSLTIARKSISLTIVLVSFAHFHTFVWWKIDRIGSKTYCNIFQYNYEIAFQMFFLIFTCILPAMAMAIFGILTIINVKKLHHRVAPNPCNATRIDFRSKSKDRQLSLMLLIQIFVTLLCTMPFSVGNITSMVFNYLIELDEYGTAINTFYSDVGRIVNYFNPIVGFYIYTLSSRTFRLEIKTMLFEFLRSISTKLNVEKKISSRVMPIRQSHIVMKPMAKF